MDKDQIIKNLHSMCARHREETQALLQVMKKNAVKPCRICSMGGDRSDTDCAFKSLCPSQEYRHFDYYKLAEEIKGLIEGTMCSVCGLNLVKVIEFKRNGFNETIATSECGECKARTSFDWMVWWKYYKGIK